MAEIQDSTIISRRDLETKIIARAWTDDDFHRKFLEDPKGQFEEHLGTKLPESLVISAHQEDANTLHFVIPAKPALDLDELSDEDLEKVAGGVGLGTSLIVSIFVTLSASAVSLAGTLSAGTIAASASLTYRAGWGR